MWSGAWDEKRPYLVLTDAIRAFRWFLEQQQFDGQIWNVVSANHSVGEIVGMIKEWVPNVQTVTVDSPLLNQLSYEVSPQKLVDAGFEFRGQVRYGIMETLRLLGGMVGTDPALMWQLLHTK